MHPFTPNFLAYLALFGWFPVTWILYSTLRPAQATAASVLGAVMFLPEVITLDAPGIPPFDKLAIGPLAALTGALWACPKRLATARPFRGVDLAFPMILLGNIGTILLNQDPLVYAHTIVPALTSYDMISATVRDTLNIYVPFFVARAIFRRPQDVLDFVKAFAIAGLIYTPLCLFEIRMSPQLHNWTYGYHQHSFAQTIRYGGYRPTVYMSHGLCVGRFMFGSLVAMATLQRCKVRVLNMRTGWLTLVLAVMLFLIKSTGSIAFGAVCLPLVLLISAKTQMRVAGLIAVIVITYPVLRATDIFPAETLVEWATEVSAERASSLNDRFEQEDMLLEKARERVVFGWGSWGRNRVYDEETGDDISVTDGEWAITLGQRGAVGFLGCYILYLAPVFMLWRRFDSIPGTKLRRLVAGAAIFIALFSADTLPNSSGSFSHYFLSGTLVGLASGGLRQASRASRLRRRQTSAAGHHPEPQAVAAATTTSPDLTKVKLR